MASINLFFVFAFCVFHVSAAEFASPPDLRFPPFASRIVGGTNATEGQAPYQCSMQTQGGNHFCGCAIINEQWILTAGHCVAGKRPESFNIAVGIIDLRSDGRKFYVSNVYIHKNYFRPKFANDIALIRLSKNISFSENVQPIPLYTKEVPDDSVLQLTGWGYLKHAGRISRRLQVINLKTMSYKKCRFSRIGKFVLVSHVCTYNKYGEGACSGDSGGPLTYQGRLVGLVNFGQAPCATGAPDAHAKISYFLNWIAETVEPKE